MPDASQPNPRASSTPATTAAPGSLAAHPWLMYVLPLAVFMLVGSFEPVPPSAAGQGATQPSAWSLPYHAYPWVYTLKIALTLLAMGLVWPGYRQFAWRLSPWAIAAGVVGAVVWIGLCRLQLESRLLAAVGFATLGRRSAFNPLEQLAATPGWAYGFLAIRFLGLVAVVPVIEEFFLRGLLMRYVIRQDWWNVPIGELNATAIAVGTLVPMAMHPGELLAAAAWFSLITLLVIKTRNIWDCVVAHAVTNLLLGIYVLEYGHWELM